MPRRHGSTTYFIEGEGVVGEKMGAFRRTTAPDADASRSATPPDTHRAFRFTRMFPDLPGFTPNDDALIALGLAMEDFPELHDHPDLPAGYTYFGQFLDHDITFDKTEGLPDGILSPDEIEQGRSPSLDLDSLYGRGPTLEEKPLYEDDKVHMRIGHTAPLGPLSADPETQILPHDLPRGDHADNPLLATIGDPRNDENLAVAQTHLAFLKLHNVVAAQSAAAGLYGEGLFHRARTTVTMHYQWIVLHDFLPRVIDPLILNRVTAHGPHIFTTAPSTEPAMPVEFSVAAYRLGHSMIRDVYSWNRNFPAATLGDLFAFTGNGGMRGLPTLPTNWSVDWRRLYDFSTVPNMPLPPALNRARSIDTALALNLRTLPGFEDAGPLASLAVRNLLRGRLLGLPSGQAIAESLGEPVLTPAQVRAGRHGALLQMHGFDLETPLWYYILKEAEVLTGGRLLGPVGSWIMAETFVGLIRGSQTSILAPENQYWRPTLPSLRPGHFTMADLLLLVNQLNPLGSEFELPAPPPPPVRIYVVRPGDTLRMIAGRFFGDERFWTIIFQANRDKISDPDLIRPGLELVIPLLEEPASMPAAATATD